jgi:phage gp29-like protein
MPLRPDRKFSSIARVVTTPHVTSAHPLWSAGSIQSALYSHRDGCFDLVSQLLDSMWEDDEFPGTLQKRVNATLRSEFQLQLPGESRDLNARELAAQTYFPTIAPDCELFDVLKDFIMLGAGVATIDWDFKHPSGIWMPKLRALPAEFLRYDLDRRIWLYEAREGEQIVEPGNGKWFLLTAGQRGWIQGLIRGLANLWYAKQLTLADWQRYNQKHGLPIIKAKVPIYRDHTEKRDFIDDLGEIQSEGVIGLPQDENGEGYDVELLEARDTAWESFQNNVERYDRKIQVTCSAATSGRRSRAKAPTARRRKLTRPASTGTRRRATRSFGRGPPGSVAHPVLPRELRPRAGSALPVLGHLPRGVNSGLG